ncbi:MAG: LptF/LptG family permease [Gammaproteobacteria bacterium]|nr:LptF/LptG family permease [Gammaproteobacteria bacterium]
MDSISNQNQLQSIEQYHLESSTQIAEIRAAESATALENTQGWQFENVTINAFHNDYVQLETQAQGFWNTPRSAEALTVAFSTEPRKMSLIELAEQIEDLKVVKRDPTPYQVEFWSKLTKPLSVFGLVLIALGFVIGSTREMGMGARLTFGIGVGFAFHYFQTLVAPMTIVFALPPAVAISVPIMLVWVVGMLVVRRVA